MTKRDYELVARTLHSALSEPSQTARDRETIRFVMKELADAFALANARFDRRKFTAASQIGV